MSTYLLHVFVENEEKYWYVLDEKSAVSRAMLPT